VTVQIDADGLAQRIIAIPGVPERQYGLLKAGVAGTVFYLEAPSGPGGPGGGGSVLHRYRLSERRAAQFATGVANLRCERRRTQARVPRDGGRDGAGRARRRRRRTNRTSLFLVDADRTPPQADRDG